MPSFENGLTDYFLVLQKSNFNLSIMNNKKTTTLILFLAISIIQLKAQTISLTKGGTIKSVPEKPSPYLRSFNNDGINYFVNTIPTAGTAYLYQVKSFSATGQAIGNTNLLASDFGNKCRFHDIYSLGNTPQFLVSRVDKKAGKHMLVTRSFDSNGKLGTTETELLQFSYDKSMGDFISSVSPNGKTLAVAGILPSAKDAKEEKIKLALYDQNLKKTSENEVAIPGENSKNKDISIIIANDGTVYFITKIMGKSDEMTLTAYQWEAKQGAELKEYKFGLTHPLVFDTYSFMVNEKNELIIAGLYNEYKGVGTIRTQGVFFFTNKNKSETLFNTFFLNAPVVNLDTRRLIANSTTIFLTAEIYKVEAETPTATPSPSAIPGVIHYDYTHQNEHIIAMDLEGNKKFETVIKRDIKVRDFDIPYFSAFFIHNDKFTVISNESKTKYTTNSNVNYNSYVPVLYQISDNGTQSAPIPFIDKLQIPATYTLYPNTLINESTGQISLMMKNNDTYQYLKIKID